MGFVTCFEVASVFGNYHQRIHPTVTAIVRAKKLRKLALLTRHTVSRAEMKGSMICLDHRSYWIGEIGEQIRLVGPYVRYD